ncbi:UNVERIFIED_CONTAM: hypothetical protein PYX00_010566 [Menopon gallinae]|uniref:Ig-like domain-containing protein n=1 Tax=Menopon gallinae TaxID=328185 RepID=A0AAW2HGW3_9NEOP
MFLSEPPAKVEFINSNGGKAECRARGNPDPMVEWVTQDNLRVTSVPSIRHVLTNGTLYFPPFEPEAFRQDVHWTLYRCVITNSVGTVVSRDVIVRAGQSLVHSRTYRYTSK